MEEKTSIEKLLNELEWMWIQHSSHTGLGTEKVTHEMIRAKQVEIENFHYDELNRVEDECTPATRADLRRRSEWE